MKINGLDLCIGCMNPLDENGECSVCRFEQDGYKPIPRCLLPGTVLAERYVLGRVLGEGNFGITYIGWDTVLNQAMAVKEYYPSDFVSRDVVRGTDKNVYVYEKQGKEEYQENLNKFLNEARCLTRFNQQPGIVSVWDFFYENQTAYIVMQYVEGMSVKQYVEKNGRMEGEQVLKLMRPVLTALGKIHKTGMVHRDISPDNILFDGDGSLVLIDFGSARVRNMEMTRSMTVVFKRGYSPEEQYRARGKQGAWSDVYAVCATMYFMLTGETPEDAIERVIGAQLRPLTEMDEIKLTGRQKEVLMKGISIKAEDRYQNVGKLMSELYEGKNETSDETTAGKAQGKKRLFLGIGVLGAICVLALIWGMAAGVSGRDEKAAPSPAAGYAVSQGAAKSDIKPVSPRPTPTPARYQMVSLRGLTKKKAKSMLDKMGDKTLIIKWKQVYSDKVKKGRITSQSIGEGTIWEEGDKKELVLKVSRGPRSVRVPDVTGKNYMRAQELLNKKKLKTRVMWEDSSRSVETVIRQSRPAGSLVKKNTQIILTVSRGLAATAPPPSGGNKGNKKKKPGDDGYAATIS